MIKGVDKPSVQQFYKFLLDPSDLFNFIDSSV